MKRPRPGIATCVRGDREVWVVWRSAAKARRGDPPDAWGHDGLAAPAWARGLIALAADHVGLEGESAATAHARAWLLRNGVPGKPARLADDAATNAWATIERLAPGTQGAPVPPPAPPFWVAVLECPWPASRAAVVAAYRVRAVSVHPDAGGTPEKFARLQRAYEAALGWCAEQEETSR